MSTDKENAELLALVKDAREHLIFFKELGVEGLEKKSAATAAKTAPETERVVSQPKPVVTAPRATPVTTEAATPASAPLFGDLSAPPVRIAKSSETFEEIWADIGDCTRCPLYQGRKNIVHTDGNRKARLMFVGEAPGADEDIQAKPFVGRAGQLLTKIIEAIGLKREEVLIGNVNRCRPPANRPPTPEEATMCKPFLLREIAAVQPEVIVVLGNTAMKNLLELKQGITKVRGQFQNYQGVKVMPTFHPAYLLRDPSKKKETWEDLKKVRDYLDSTRKQES
ncbi:MAG TPA: uracil-DNA glycosylase [Pyrinomonadaceae bacterium]|jgi:DNA polymerase|nr:uracil-DNA glycosylase [Pyrinomonadaceae bacterium]